MPTKDKQLTLADVAKISHLEISVKEACKGKGSHRGTQKLKDETTERAHELHTSLITRVYRPGEYKQFTINERGKERIIQHLSLDPDGVVFESLISSSAQKFTDLFSENTHAAIKNHGVHTALKQLRRYLKNDPDGTRYCYKIDVKKYFPTINRTILKQQLRRMFADDGILWLFDLIIDSAPGDCGIPIGNYTSQYLANLYLTPLVHWAQNTLKLHYYIRYMDDIVILAGSKDELHAIHREIDWYLRRNLYLEIKGNWQIFPVADRGIDFGGYRTWPNKVLLRKSTLKRMIVACRKIRKNILYNDTFDDHDRSVISSYMGWVLYCTPKVRHTLYANYFKPILDLLPQTSKPQVPEGLLWNEPMHKYQSTSNSRPQSAVERT